MKTFLLPNARLTSAFLASLALVACGQPSPTPHTTPLPIPDAAVGTWDTSVSGQDTEPEPDAAQIVVDAPVQLDTTLACATPKDCPGVDGVCRSRTCTAGVCGFQNAKSKTSCGSNMLCDGEGQCVGCMAASDCPGSDNECGTRSCTAGVCAFSFLAKGTALSTQQTGDCHKRQCDGAGNIVDEVDDTDMPVDGLPCTRDLCQGGTPNNTPTPASISCGTDLYCDGTGACVSCVQPSDCGTDTECQVRTCLAGCGVQNVAAGTLIAQQVAGDCHTIRCDGAGATSDAVDDTDLPVDGNPCTRDVCTQGVESNPPLPAGTACGTGLLCDGNGACVGCRQASDCGGADTECQVRTCVAGVCGLQNTTTGTAVSKQVAGDCHTVRCNGSGATTNAVDDTDLPVDGNACTRDVCTLGVKSNPKATAGTTCSTGVCNSAGTCVACVEPTDCSGVDTECQIRTCTDGICGVQKKPVGTVLASQVPGDCHRKACDGNGGINDNEDNSDLPLADGNQCTTEICSAGSGSHPPAPRGTACNQDGGAFCDGAGACVACLAPTDCPGTDNDCRTRTCIAGTCGFSYLANGTAAATQPAGDCHRNLCDGVGNINSVVDDNDLPVDDHECTRDLCTAGVPSNPPLAASTPCGQGGSNYCDGTGVCVGCITKDTCPGSDTECQTRTCTGGVCGFSYTATNTALTSQTPGDCQKNVCNGSGTVTSIADPDDVPADDGKACTSDVCISGVPSHPPVTAHTACTQDGGSFCNSAGACVACLTPADCGSDTECQTRTCSPAGACGVFNKPNDTVLASQTDGDCHKNVCDGSGNVANIVDDTDPPSDGKACTNDVCTGGVPSHPPVAVHTACSEGGGSFCNSEGACVACLSPADCGSDTECQTRTCSPAGACGIFNTPGGTLVALQADGDCHKNVCDGSGGIRSDVEDADVPVDGNQCTDDTCTAGVPSNPPLASSTSCAQNGGLFCNGAGACVACVTKNNCPGVDTGCGTRTCSSEGICGFSYVATGGDSAIQTAGDCNKNVCDGSGGSNSIIDINDLPPDDGNQCTGETCNAGAPEHPFLASGSTCTQSGGQICDGAGACVACSPEKCPGSDTECRARTCTAGACGFLNAPNTTPCGTTGHCDGSGECVMP